MEKLHVLLTVPLQEAEIQMIEAVDPRLDVAYAMEEVLAELGLPRTTMSSLMKSARQRDIPPTEASRALDGMLTHTEVIFGWRLPRKVRSRAPRLKWVQSSSVGIDLMVAGSGLLESEVILTTASGVSTTAVAEAALGLIFMLAKKASVLIANQGTRRWEPLVFAVLKGKTMGIVGLGKIGREVARVAKALGMTTLSSTKLEDDTSGVDRVFPPEQLRKMLPDCDFVVVTVPLTPETKGLIGEAELKAMKPTAYLVNVSRGTIIRQEMLIRALKEGWIAGAGLDVYEVEPLPTSSELWTLPGVIVSPHSAGVMEQYMTAVTGIFCENLRHFLAGEPLVNEFNKKRGY